MGGRAGWIPACHGAPLRAIPPPPIFNALSALGVAQAGPPAVGAPSRHDRAKRARPNSDGPPWHCRAEAALPVRPRGRLISTVKVRVGVCQGSVVEGNCVVARRGGEQPEANWRSAGDEPDSAGRAWRASWERAKPETHPTRCDGVESDVGTHLVVGGGTSGR